MRGIRIKEDVKWMETEGNSKVKHLMKLNTQEGRKGNSYEFMSMSLLLVSSSPRKQN